MPGMYMPLVLQFAKIQMVLDLPSLTERDKIRCDLSKRTANEHQEIEWKMQCARIRNLDLTLAFCWPEVMAVSNG
jgi:hypothetical protein